MPHEIHRRGRKKQRYSPEWAGTHGLRAPGVTWEVGSKDFDRILWGGIRITGTAGLGTADGCVGG
jgi:hypothetical protein